jgi:AraC-like DNA-binding protein
MLRVEPLFASPLVSIDRIDHPSDVAHVDPDEEVSQSYSINLLERGHFSVEYARRQWTVGERELFVTVPGQTYRYGHRDHGRAPDDVCLAIAFKDDLPPRRRYVAVLRDDNRRAYLRRRLRANLHDGARAITLEAIAGELRLATLAPVPSERLFRPSQLDWYAHRVDMARRMLDETYATPHTLSSLGRAVGMSPFHFARVFRELTGTPPHRYLLQRRLAAAVERLRDGAPVTETCYAVGFQSLSHFIHSFRRAFGRSPSRPLTPDQIRDLREHLPAVVDER